MTDKHMSTAQGHMNDKLRNHGLPAPKEADTAEPMSAGERARICLDAHPWQNRLSPIKVIAEQIRQAEQAARLDEREKALEEAIPEKWPVRGPDFNSWNADAAKFLKIVQSNPNLWLKNSQLKYLILRVDTRPGCHFMVEDRDGNKIPADAVMAAIRALKAKA